LVTGLVFDRPDPIAHRQLRRFRKSSLSKFFVFGHETAYIWSPASEEYCYLVVEVPSAPTAGPPLRTLASALPVCLALTARQEHSQMMRYEWISDFDPAANLSEQGFLTLNGAWRLGSSTKSSMDYWARRADVLELLLRSEPFFVASQLLCESFKNHWFCLECAQRPAERRDHPHGEPEIWDVATNIPAMEAAIVQATRAVEALLGKPGRRESGRKVQRNKERWRDSTDLDPDELFPLARKSYFDYYYELFSVRADSAHSSGRLSSILTRSMAVAAQTFADAVVFAHFKHSAVPLDVAQNLLSFNQCL
jgi:hypothetical protein